MSPRRKRSSKIRLILQLIPVLVVAIAGIVGATQLDVVREFLAGASGEEANLQIDPTVSYGPMTKPWNNLAQGGEMSDWTLEPIQGKVAALDPEYIRIDHIYSFYDVVQLNGEQLTYDFTKLDRVVDGITATGAKPYIALSYMPIPLSDDGTITGKPKRWEHWQDLVRATIHHYSVEKGINDVIYEVWNEPDLFGGWKTYGENNYLTLYTYADRGRAQVQNARPYQFGGPAITAFYRNWFTGLVEHAQNNNLRLDFFSWHRYNHDVERFRKDFAEATELRATYPAMANLEFHVTEYGHDSEVHVGYDTSYGAAHTAATSIEMVGNIDRAFVFEIEDGKDPKGQERWGRWGLLTHRDFGNNIKPRYLALRLMNRIGGERVQLLGKGTWVKAVATRNENTLEMLVANFDQYGSHVENVPVTFDNMKPGSYTFEVTDTSGQTRQTPLEAVENTVSTELFMGANSVVYVRLIPQTPEAGPLESPAEAPVETETNPNQVIQPNEAPAEIQPEEPQTGFGNLL
ncbi:glycosyl hydrolase [Candidatus Woesebacteria bacterium]|nr:glycosyl hydrolase [Candidatus Woesebacteria bacterium]MCD8507193.1 glycosyl hydrolase [Candidatus Woesebacteria bacterium]MCD8526812.1 glycosyl hydrolase [Candidatus Woesebacteria bacterium]MCD8545967.1 glycosyl hydrolase [Candidatus Woesebacteria bacterium]